MRQCPWCGDVFPVNHDCSENQPDDEPDWEAEALAEGDRRYSQMKDEGLI